MDCNEEYVIKKTTQNLSPLGGGLVGSGTNSCEVSTSLAQLVTYPYP